MSQKPDISKANICPPCPTDASTWDKLVYWLGIGLGSGLPKRAPGTWGTLGGLVIALPMMALGFVPFLIITVLACIFGVYICGHTSKLMGVHDDPHIVWDEWVGMWIALLPLVYIEFPQKILQSWNDSFFISLFSSLLFFLFVAFSIFRFFDIMKPFPISWLDKRVSGGFGIMIDDIIAGIIAIPFFIIICWFSIALFNMNEFIVSYGSL